MSDSTAAGAGTTLAVGSATATTPALDAATATNAAPQPNRQTVRLGGRFDVRNVGELRARLHGAIDTGNGLLRVDVAGLELADHAGLGVLLGGARRARQFGRSMVLVDVPATLAKLLAAHRLSLMIRVEEKPELLHLGHA